MSTLTILRAFGEGAAVVLLLSLPEIPRWYRSKVASAGRSPFRPGRRDRVTGGSGSVPSSQEAS